MSRFRMMIGGLNLINLSGVDVTFLSIYGVITTRRFIESSNEWTLKNISEFIKFITP